MISFADAIEQALLEQDASLVTDYELFLTAWRLFESGSFNDTKIRRLPADWDVVRTRGMIRKLANRASLLPEKDFKSSVWRLVKSSRKIDIAETACIADPFCYVSHMSAMQRYGLTDQIPQALHLSRPARTSWNRLRDAKVAQEGPPRLVDELAALLVHLNLADALGRKPVEVHETKYPAKMAPVQGERTRLSDLGATFIDMLEAPHLCGGMAHVLNVWETRAREWINPIIEAADVAPAGIVKVRAGYVLSERMGISDPRIEAWRAFAQRGGSRKLDPSAEYRSIFSEAWMISLNA